MEEKPYRIVTPTDCGDPKCREGLICMIGKKVSKTVLLTVTLGIIGSVGYFTAYGLSANAKEKRQLNTQNIAVMQEQIYNIDAAVKRIENKQMTPQDIVKAVKEAIGK